MGYHIPGTVILYRESGSSLPLWPSIYCTDEIAPEAFSRNRPSGFYNLVLKLARVLDSSQLRWALTSEMHEFDPSAADEETKKSTTGLEDAYDVALEALQHGLDLDHWKSALATEQVNGAITIDSEDNDDWSNEPQMLEAIRLGIISAPLQKVAHTPSPPGLSGICTTIQSGQRPSRPAHSIPHLWDSQPSLSVRKQTQQPSRLPTPTPSPPRKTNPFVHPPRLPKRPSPPSPAYSDDKTSSLSRRRKLGTDMWRQASSYQSSLQLSQSTISPNSNFSDGEEPLPRPRRRKSSTVSVPKTQTYLPPQQACESNKAAGSGLSSKEVFMRNGLNASVSAVPDDDIIEGDLDESNQFVRIFIGPEIDPADDPTIDPYRRRHKLQLLKHHLWDRSYFRGDNLSGRNYITPVGDNTWELVHPRLVDISPEDFRWAAEFLSDGDFGIRKVGDEEQAAETFAQCVSAWRTAESLSMDDLLEHIVEKLRNARPFWDLWNVFAFACSIYQSEVSLQAHDELKDLFSEFIANHFYIYVEDDHLRNTFLTRLKQLPELEKGVLLKIVARLTQQLSPQDEEIALPEEIEEVTEDHMDLYE